jgi:hypothetical protein
MGLFRRRVPGHYIPIHPDNIAKKDWIILLEAGTIVGHRDEKLRVALSTLERKIVRKYNILLKPSYFLLVPGYDPRIHALYFCPQLYTYDTDDALVPLEGEEIGKLVARAVEDAVVEKQPWYEPSEKLPSGPVISGAQRMDFETVVVTRSEGYAPAPALPEESAPAEQAA